MRIECPHCTAVYEVPEERLTGRKAVRCARCLAEFVPAQPTAARLESALAEQPAAVADPLPEQHDQPPAPPKALAAVPADGAPAISAMQRLVQSAPPPRRSFGPLIGWVLSLLVLAFALWAVFNWRTEIMQAWPPSTRAYAALGLTQSTK